MKKGLHLSGEFKITWIKIVKVKKKTREVWAEFFKQIADEIYPKAKKIMLVIDNYNIRTAESLYEKYFPQELKRICGYSFPTGHSFKY